MPSLKMVVGLGNPGPQYHKNRHNIGFQCIERFAARHQFDNGKMQLRAMTTQGFVRLKQAASSIASDRSDVQKVLLVKPLTFMNASGEAVGQLARFYQIEPADLLVIHDDLDLPSGRLRLRPNGSAGGQNGVKSIIQHLGTQEFARIRVGIGRPPGRMDAAAYVLQDFSAEEEQSFAILRQEVCDAIESWLFEGMTAAMNRFNKAERVTG